MIIMNIKENISVIFQQVIQHPKKININVQKPFVKKRKQISVNALMWQGFYASFGEFMFDSAKLVCAL